MFKSLAGKALVPVGLAVTGFVVVCFLLLYTMVKNVVTRDAVGHAANLANMALKSTRYAMLESDRDMLTTMVHNIGDQNGVEHVRIFNKRGVVNFSSKAEETGHQVDKRAEGCIGCHAGPSPATTLGKMEQARTFRNKAGTDVLAITAPIYNEPECSNAACHVHPSSQKVLGTLDIGLSQEMMLASLASIRNQMIIFTVMVLALTVGGVTALLRRSVFLPMQKLTDFVEEAEGENELSAPPHRFPHELDRVAKSYYNLNLKLRKSQQELGRIRKKEVHQE